MGRSRGGLTTKIHALVDADGLPVRLHLSEGQMNDCTQAEALLDALEEGTILLADKGYDTEAIRATAEEAGAFANIPARRNRTKSFAFSRFLYRYHNLVERFFGKLKQAQASPPDTTSGQTTSLLPSSSSQPAFGSELMSLRCSTTLAESRN